MVSLACDKIIVLLCRLFNIGTYNYILILFDTSRKIIFLKLKIVNSPPYRAPMTPKSFSALKKPAKNFWCEFGHNPFGGSLDFAKGYIPTLTHTDMIFCSKIVKTCSGDLKTWRSAKKIFKIFLRLQYSPFFII